MLCWYLWQSYIQNCKYNIIDSVMQQSVISPFPYIGVHMHKCIFYSYSCVFGCEAGNGERVKGLVC